MSDGFKNRNIDKKDDDLPKMTSIIPRSLWNQQAWTGYL